jgi:hypothetical protein
MSGTLDSGKISSTFLRGASGPATDRTGPALQGYLARSACSVNHAVVMNTAQPQATTCDHACGERPVAEERRLRDVLDTMLVLACGTFFLFLAVAGSLWILADLSATLLPVHHGY